jgi:hypothetical protein
MIMDDLENVFDDDLGLDDTPEIEVTPPITQDDFFDTSSEPFDEESSSIIDEFLSLNGISNGIIKYTDEDNTEKEVSFYELSKNEQLEILKSFAESPAEAPATEPVKDKFLEYLETNNLTVDDFLAQYRESIINEISSQYEQNYEIDAYDDQELYLLDLKTKFELTDEELTEELEKELKNPTMFKKKVDSLRSEYKKLEDQYKETQQVELANKRQQEYEEFADTIVDIAYKNSEFYGIELEDNEKNEVLSFLLDLDDSGVSNFYKELSKPEKLYEVAWFVKYGKEAFDALRNAYESEIAKIKKDSKGAVVIKSTPKNKNNNIHDLF